MDQPGAFATLCDKGRAGCRCGAGHADGLKPSLSYVLRDALRGKARRPRGAARGGPALRDRELRRDAERSADLGEFEKLHALLEAWFPRVHAALERTVVNRGSLIFRWKGSTSEAPYAVTHLGVVPPGSADGWDRPPFRGDVAADASGEECVWGRGAIDDKNMVLAHLEAVEDLLEAGVSPRRDVDLLFGHDEEVGGLDGAKRVAAHLRTSRAWRASTSSSTRALRPWRLERRPMPSRPSVALAMFATLRGGFSWPLELVVSNLWLFGPVLAAVLASKPETASLVGGRRRRDHLRSGQKKNVLPDEAVAYVNHRLHPDDSLDDVLAHDRRVIADPYGGPPLGVEVEVAFYRSFHALVSGGVMGGVAFGVSASFGLFLKPITDAENLKRQVIGLAVGLNMLVQGFSSIGWGALTDTYGAAPVMACGAALEVASLVATSYSEDGWQFYLAVPVEGLATGALSFSVVLGAVGKLVAPERRSRSLGMASSTIAIGNVVVPPITYAAGVAVLSAAMRLVAGGCVVMFPLCLCFAAAARTLRRGRADYAAAAKAGDGSRTAAASAALSLGETVRTAAATRSYRLVFAGFFVCGFHVFFVRTHFPAYLSDRGLPEWVGAASLSLIGLGNVCGTFVAGMLAQRYEKRKPRILACIYAARSLVFAAIALNDRPSVAFALAISCVIGLLWLSTVGSFFGAWLGGKVFDAHGSYAPMWWLCVGAGLLAAADHLPIEATRIFDDAAPAAVAARAADDTAL
ncbi:monocarboxylate transporter [Aureococcus anophagefferens]|nr:monocarboxylate transporter [Aureococcus anophagefferens]